MKRKLLIINGAGASLDFGMPSVKEIDSLFETWAKEISHLKNDSTKSLYSWVKEKLYDYSIQNSRNRIETIIHFENILYTTQNLSMILSDTEWKNFNNRLNPFIEVKDLPVIFNYFKKEKIADGSDFHFLHTYLVDKLLDHFRSLCNSSGLSRSKEITKLKLFYDSLKEDFQFGFVNLNYDNVVLSALPDLETGFDRSSGDFLRSNLYSHNWNFCYHIHGSVYFDMDMKDDRTAMHKIYWNGDLSSRFKNNSSGRSGHYTSEGVNHLSSSIIIGLDKANQLLKEPFGSYFMQLDRLIYEADAILFIGYGFNDTHLNNAFSFIRHDKKKRKVVIIDWASEDEDGLTFRHDDWSFGLFTTLPFNGSEIGDGKSKMPQPAFHYKSNKILEKSSNPDYPLAVWYDGILEACDNVQKIKAELI